MAFTSPSPQMWTLRLKSRKTTVLIHADPLHTFSTIKANLYTALQETGLKDPNTGASLPLPSSPSDIQLGRPVDKDNAQLGFQLGEWEYPSLDDDAENGKGKGKAKAGRKSGGMADSVKDCPKGAGLKDGSVLAFRWRGDGNAGWQEMEDEDLDIDGETSMPVGGKKPDMWGVQLADWEDAYGVRNETDVGGGREFEG